MYVYYSLNLCDRIFNKFTTLEKFAVAIDKIIIIRNFIRIIGRDNDKWPACLTHLYES